MRFRSRITELGVLELWCVSTAATAAGSWSSASGRMRGKREGEVRAMNSKGNNMTLLEVCRKR